MSEAITFVGIDAHKVELHVALLAANETEPVSWTVRNEVRAVERLRRKLERVAPGPISCCYEAGPCGYALQRQLDRGRVRCEVIAPARDECSDRPDHRRSRGQGVHHRTSSWADRISESSSPRRPSSSRS